MKIILTFTLLMIPGVVSSISVTGDSGGGVMIPCNYDKIYTENKKYFCKVQLKTCSDLIKTDKKNNSGRFSLYDDTRSAVFNVTIRDLTELDSGTYWCGIERAREDLHTEVNLEVIREPKINPPPLLPSSSPSSSSSSSSSSSLIISVTVILLLLIIGFMSCIVILYKRQTRDTDSAAKVSEPGTENSEAVPQTLHIYDEIKDTRLDCKSTQLPINPSDSCKTVYATPQLPTNPSVEWHKQCNNQLPQNPSDTSTVYDTAQLPTNPSDSSKTVYATPQLPTNPSDSSDMVRSTLQLPTNPSDTRTVYATPQLPTIPSDSSNTV